MHRALCMMAMLVCLAFKANAQQDYFETYYTFGPILKVVQSNFSFDNGLVNTLESEPEVGYQFGGFFRTRVNNLYVQTELLFARTQNTLVFRNYNNVQGFNPRAEFEFNSLEIPILIGRFFENLRIETGPAVSVLLGGDRFFLNEKVDISNDFNNVSLQYRFAVGLDLNDVIVNLNYEVGLSKAGENLRNLVGSDFEPKRNQIGISIAVALLYRKKRQ